MERLTLPVHQASPVGPAGVGSPSHLPYTLTAGSRPPAFPSAAASPGRNDTRVDQSGTSDWTEYTLTIAGTGRDVLRHQRVSGEGNPCLDAIRVEAVP